MASIWTQGPGTDAVKLKGNLAARPELIGIELANCVRLLAKRNGAKLVLDEPFEKHLAWPDGMIFAVWAEFFSPPSREERGQPKRREKSQ